jgi:hypothetical protein
MFAWLRQPGPHLSDRRLRLSRRVNHSGGWGSPVVQAARLPIETPSIQPPE